MAKTRTVVEKFIICYDTIGTMRPDDRVDCARWGGVVLTLDEVMSNLKIEGRSPILKVVNGEVTTPEFGEIQRIIRE